MNFVCIVFELGDKMLTLSSMENLIVQCNLQGAKNNSPRAGEKKPRLYCILNKNSCYA